MELDDERLERRLRQLRPVGPPSSLRARVLKAPPARQSRAIWIWLPAAAMLAIAVVSWRTQRIYSAIAQPHLAITVAEREVAIDQLSHAWGGSDASRAAAAAALAAIGEASRGRERAAATEEPVR